MNIIKELNRYMTYRSHEIVLNMAETTKMGPITFIFKTKYIKKKKKACLRWMILVNDTS